METSRKKWRKALIGAAMALLISFAAVGVATFAWYIYNTSSHTTKLSMAAGSSSSLLISDAYDGEYKSAISFAPTVGQLLDVSTNCIQNGFQEVAKMKDGGQGQPKFIAYMFRKAPESDYYMRTMYLKTTDVDKKVYVANIGYTDSSEVNPISAATRVGIVTYKPGDPNARENEYIFEINPDGTTSGSEYNTEKGSAGHVLDSTKTDGSTLPFTPYSPKDYYYDKDGVTLNANPLKITTCPASGEPVRVDVYIWLEGCDPDCHGEVGNLENLYVEYFGEE